MCLRVVGVRSSDHGVDQARKFLKGMESSLCHLGGQVRAALIVVLTRGGSTARLVAKYRPSIPVLTVAVPVLTTDSLTWSCSGEGPARQCLVTRGLLPVLAEGSARATDTDTTDEILQVTAVIPNTLLLLSELVMLFLEF